MILLDFIMIFSLMGDLDVICLEYLGERSLRSV